MKIICKNQSGSALLITMALMVMLTLLSIVAVNRSTTDIELSYNQLHSDKAFYVAEAGIKRAFTELQEDEFWTAGFVKQSIGDGIYNVTVIDSSTVAALDDTVLLRSHGVVDGASASLEAMVVPFWINPFMYAAFGDTLIQYDKLSCSDSYNSDSGTYVDTQDPLGGDVGTNGTMTLSGGATIGGDATVSEGGTLDISGGSTVTGDTITGGDAQTVEPIPDIEFDSAQYYNNASSGISGTNYSYNSSNDKLVVRKNGDVTLTTGIYYFSNIKIEMGAQLILAPGAEVVIYLTNSFTAAQDSKLNSMGIPTNLQIYSKGTTFEVSQSTEMYASVYAPNADIAINQNDMLYGSLIGKSVTLSQGACIHYDRTLSKVTKRQMGEVAMIAWKEM